jgi:hypothetical protein
MARTRDQLSLPTLLRVGSDVTRLIASLCRPRVALAAENLFLRKQLALYVERQAKPRRADDATRIALVALSRIVDWRRLLTIVQPATLLRWHRTGFRLFWRWKSKPRGRPRVPAELRQLIKEMARANRTWGEERIAAELLLKLGVRVSPRTVRRYMPPVVPPNRRSHSLAWSTFVKNHAHAVLACDFFLVATATFRLCYVFVVLEIGTRRIVHWNVTRHPSACVDGAAVSHDHARRPQSSIRAARSRQHLFGWSRSDAGGDGADRAEDASAGASGECILRTPDRHDEARVFEFHDSAQRTASPRDAVAVGCPLQSRPPACQPRPGIPDPSPDLRVDQVGGHRIASGHRVVATPILGGLHHEYRLEAEAA